MPADNDFNDYLNEGKKKKNHRRSSIFQRRLSVFAQDSFIIDDDVFGSEHGIDSPENEEKKLTEYIKKLKTEKEDWRKLLARLKKENSEFNEKTSQVNHVLSWDLLREADKKFLEERPDYASLGRLLDSTARALALRHRRFATTNVKLYNLVEDCELSINYITAVIIQKTMEEFNELDLQSEE